MDNASYWIMYLVQRLDALKLGSDDKIYFLKAWEKLRAMFLRLKASQTLPLGRFQTLKQPYNVYFSSKFMDNVSTGF